MKENKYYTPEISEFHVGFEYEELNHYKKWIPKIFGGFLPKTINEYISKNECRVKYLDREDIEECGWVYNEEEGRFRFRDNEMYSLTVFHNEAIMIKYIWRETEHNENFDFKFDGTIKNKSELKRLMKQLNIEAK